MSITAGNTTSIYHQTPYPHQVVSHTGNNTPPTPWNCSSTLTASVTKPFPSYPAIRISYSLFPVAATENEINLLTQYISLTALEEEEQEHRMKLPTPVREGREVSVESWMKQRRVPLTADDVPGPSHDPVEILAPLNSPLPPSLLSIPHLPPSLAPTTPESWLDVEFAKWG